MTDRENFIRANMQKKFEKAQAAGYKIFTMVLQGSQNYNLDVYTDEYKSDVDVKCIVLPTFEDIVHNRAGLSYTDENNENDEHIDYKDIRVMFDLFKKQNLQFVEVLFSDFYIVPDEYREWWKQLRAMAEELVHCFPSKFLNCSAGMSMEKRKALEHRYPKAEWKIDKWGYDGKQLHHIIRLNDFMTRYVAGESYKKCLTPTEGVRELLVNAKLNKYSLEEARQLAAEYDERNKKLKNDYIEAHGDVCDPTPFLELDRIKTEVLRYALRKDLLEG